MRYMTSIIVGAALSALVAAEAAAQWNVARFEGNRNRLYTTFGMDPAMITAVGYGRVVAIGGHRVQLGGDAGVGAAHMDAHDFRARLGAQASLLHWRSAHLTGSMTLIARGTENAIYRGFNWGADVTGTLGVYRPRWFAAAEAGLDKAVITHVSHTRWYRDNFYPDARDGWYLDAGGTFRNGVTAGVALGRMELVGRFGSQRTERFEPLPSPLYGSIGVGLSY